MPGALHNLFPSYDPFWLRFEGIESPNNQPSSLGKAKGVGGEEGSLEVCPGGFLLLREEKPLLCRKREKKKGKKENNYKVVVAKAVVPMNI